MNSLVIVILVVAVIFVFFISLYNSLVAKQNQVKSVEAGIDAQLKRRYDLIPNLVATAKEYMVHEKGLLENITALRESARSASTNEEKFELNNKISSSSRSLRSMPFSSSACIFYALFFKKITDVWSNRFIFRDIKKYIFVKAKH